MQTRQPPSRCSRASTSGYSLIELVAVIVLLGIVASTSFFVVLEAMRAFARTQPLMEASYEANFVATRLLRDIRDIPDSASIQSMGDAGLEFASSTGDLVTYEYSNGALTRNSHLLAESLKGFAFGFESASGGAAATPDEVHLIRVKLVAESGLAAVPMALAIFPRGLQR